MPLSLGNWHTWVALAVAILILGFVLRQIGARVPMVDRVVKASLG